jgi:biopolymer transport protein TolR
MNTMMLNRSQSKRRMAEINIVPYVDVMLVLLVIFMITTPLLTQGVNVDLPQATAKALPPKPQLPLVVTVAKDGRYYLNVATDPKAPISVDALTVRIAAELHRDPKRPVLVRGDREVNYGKVVTAMVVLQEAGAPNVGLVTEEPHHLAASE